MTSTPELVVKPLHGEAYHFPLEKDVISIGRSKRNDLVLADQWLSRHHAEIRNDDGDFTIADLDPQPAAGQAARVRDGCGFGVAGFSFSKP